jgi:hypothetical protein
VLLAARGAHETQIEASFCEAIRIATEQKSVSLEKRAEATYAEYRTQKGAPWQGTGSDNLFGNFCNSLLFVQRSDHEILRRV